MKFWEALLIGSMMRPKQARYAMFDGEGTCALGAVYEAVGWKPEENPHCRGVSLPEFAGLVGTGDDVCPCGCGENFLFFSTVVHLNNEASWSREKIALEFVKPIEEAWWAQQGAKELEAVSA